MQQRLRPAGYIPETAMQHGERTSDYPVTNPSASIFRFLRKQQFARGEEIAAWQFERLRTLLAHAIQYVPWYRKQLGGLDPNTVQSPDELRQLPILTRPEIQQHPTKFLAESLPTGVQAIGKSSTSGSTGIPLEVHSTNVRQQWWLALCLRDIVWCGMDPRDSLLGLRKVPHGRENDPKLVAGIKAKNWGPGLESLTRTGPAYLMDVQQDPVRQLAFARQVEPDYIVSYPSNLLHLSRLVREQRAETLHNLKAIQAIAEELTAEGQAEIGEAFGVPVKNVYTCEEAGYIASPCPDADCLHVHEENVIFEVLNEQNQPCEPGTVGRVVLTPLHNDYMPLVRYDIGDFVELAEPCTCGRSLTAIRQVIGKHRPLMHLPNGTKKSSHVLAGIIRDVGGFHQFQLRQTMINELHLNLVPAAGWNTEQSDRMVAEIQAFFEAPISVTLDCCERIRPERSGKLQSFVSDL